MKQLLRLYNNKAYSFNLKFIRTCSLNLQQYKHSQQHQHNEQNQAKIGNRLSLNLNYFFSAQKHGGMKFKSKFSKNNCKNQTSNSVSLNQTGQNKQIQKQSQKWNHEKQSLALIEQYLNGLKSSQYLENQQLSLEEFSLDIKQKSMLVNKENTPQEENIQENFDWMQKLVYDSEKNLEEQSVVKNKENLEVKTKKNQEKIIKRQFLYVKKFDTDLPKTLLIENSRKFLQYICHLFNQYQQLRIMNQIKQYVKKNQFFNNSQSTSKFSTKKLQELQEVQIKKQTKKLRQQRLNQQLKFFKSMKELFCEFIVDPQLVDKILMLLSKSDPKILKIQDLDKFVYKHEQKAISPSKKQKQTLQIIFRNLPNYLQNNQNFHTSIEQINKDISSKMSFLQQIQTVNQKSKEPHLKGKQNSNQEQDLVNVFQEFSKLQKQGHKKNRTNQINQNSKQKQFKLLMKKPSQEAQKQFQIKESSLNQIDRVFFKNTKIVQDKILMKKQKKNIKNMSSKQKQEEQKRLKFGQNWIYAYELPYALTIQQAKNITQYISKRWGDITQLYVYPYKNFLQKKQSEAIHIQIEEKKKIQQQQTPLTSQDLKQIKRQQMTDKLLEKISKQKYLKLNKTSMIFKFKQFQDKKKFLSNQLRLYGLNIALYRNIRFQQAQSKTILALSMIPWGCFSTDLINAINVELKAINVQVTYQKCIIAKGYIFIQFDSFYQTLKGQELLNNLIFQNQRLKAQINYGSSKVHLQKYKGNLQMDHYETLIGKLKQINCFYNELYQ